jgi:SAM-dependent methyltransferase
MLAAFAELVQAAGGGPVADLGCGPGRVTAHLDGPGVAAFGVDLSPGMVDVARQTYPGLRFARRAPGGHLLLGFHAGEERIHSERACGHAVSFDVYLLPPGRIAELLSEAGARGHRAAGAGARRAGKAPAGVPPGPQDP